MFTEILKVKPVLDKAAAKNMETSLSARFKRVTSGFGKGLKLSLKAAAIAGGAALTSSLMNPIKEVEEKVKELLNKGKSLGDTAADLGTTAGKLGQLQAVAQAKGMDPDKLNSMLESFQKQRDDVAYKQSQGQKLDANETLLSQLPADTIDAFMSFNETLKGMDDKTKARVSRDILGDETSRGTTRRFLDSDWNKEARSLALPSQQRINRSTEKLGQQANKDLRQQATRDLKQMVDTGENKSLTSVVDTMNKREDAQAKRFQDQLDQYKELAQVRAGVDKVGEGIDSLIKIIGEAIPTMVNGFNFFTSGKFWATIWKELKTWRPWK